MGQRPEELRADIEARRENMGVALDAIGDRVSPGQVVDRQKAAVRQRVRGWREAVMGSPYYQPPESSGPSLGGAVQEKASDFGQQVTGAPEAARRSAAGNPLAAGLIAFGAGLLVASVLPESETEQGVAQQLQPQLEAAASTAADIGQGVAEKAKDSATEAGQQLKDTATDAAQQVKGQATDATAEVKDHAQDAAQTVKDKAQ